MPRNKQRGTEQPAIDRFDGEQLCELLKSLKLGMTSKMVEEVSVEADCFAQN